VRLFATAAAAFVLAARCRGEEQHFGRWSGTVVYRGVSTPAGNRDVTLRVFPGADHELLVSEPSKTWKWPRLASGFVPLLLDWTASRAKTSLRR
jgi:hypothetical protein